MQGAGMTPQDNDKPDDADNEQTQASIENIGDDDNDVQDTDDGGAIVTVDPDAKQEQARVLAFYDNLAPDIDPSTLAQLNSTLQELIKEDWKQREQREKQYEEGIQRTGMSNSAPGGASFSGASKAAHPVLAKAAIDFEARAIAELMPASGAVKEYIPGTSIKKERVEKARRVSEFMNWQLTKQMPEFRGELEQCLSQVPLGGSQFMYLCNSDRLKRPTATYWPSDDVAIPFSASSVLAAERVTQRERITQATYKQRVASGYYVEPLDTASAMTPELGPAATAAAKIEGKSPDPFNQDGLREIWRVYCDLELDDDEETKGESATYIVEMNADGSGIKRVVRNWEQDDELRIRMQWLIEFPFLPWRGALSIGLAHAIGGLASAATGALRSLLDAAHINNFQGGLRLKGANFAGQSTAVEPGTFVEIEGGTAGINDDIRKLVMAFPYNQPSPVLFQLLGFLGDEAESVVQTTLKNLQDAAGSNLPVGTTLAMIEQGMKVFAGVHQRLLAAMTQLFEVLHRINRLYLTDEQIKKSLGPGVASHEDFEGPMDVIPVADPNVFSDAQRFAQMQVVADRAMQNPQLYDMRKVEEMILKRTRIPDAEDLLQPKPDIGEQNSVNENAAMAVGRPAATYPQQDHLAHLQVHLDFLTSPVFGQLRVIAPKLIPLMLDHVAHHVSLWYVQQFYEASSKLMPGGDIAQFMGTKDPEAEKELDRLLAQLSPDIVQAAGQQLSKLPPIIQAAQQLLAQMQPQQPGMPPDSAPVVAQIGAASREKVAGMQLQAKQMDAQTQQQRDAAKAAADARIQQQRDAAANARTQADNQVKLQVNSDDNTTALTIAADEIAAGRRSDLSTGTGINPH